MEKKEEEAEEDAPKIVTTDEEKEAYYIIKSILRDTITPERVDMKDNQSYCSIILDNNSRKYFIRLYFDGTKKHFNVFDNQRNESRFDMEDINDIYQKSESIINAVKTFIDSE